jgi:hypothetical protein
MGIDVVTFEAGRCLLVPVGCCGTIVEVGWGEWTKTLHSKERWREVIIDIPEEARGHPGHYIVTDFNRHGVSEWVGARPLPPCRRAREPSRSCRSTSAVVPRSGRCAA